MGEIGTGTTVSFASGFLAEILSISGPTMSRGSVDMSHMGTTTNKVFKPTDLSDMGELTVELLFIPQDTPPINDAPESIAITFPDSAASVWTFTGFLTGFDVTDPLEDRMTATAKIKITGGVVIT